MGQLNEAHTNMLARSMCVADRGRGGLACKMNIEKQSINIVPLSARLEKQYPITGTQARVREGGSGVRNREVEV